MWHLCMSMQPPALVGPLPDSLPLLDGSEPDEEGTSDDEGHDSSSGGDDHQGDGDDAVHLGAITGQGSDIERGSRGRGRVEHENALIAPQDVPGPSGRDLRQATREGHDNGLGNAQAPEVSDVMCTLVCTVIVVLHGRNLLGLHVGLRCGQTTKCNHGHVWRKHTFIFP